MDKRKNKSQKWKDKLSKANKGNKPWNTGLSGDGYTSHLKNGRIWNKGIKGYKIHSEEHKEKLREKLTGNKLREGIPPWNKGMRGEYKLKPKTKEVRERISKSLKNYPCYKNKERGKNISIAQKKHYKEHPERVEAFKKLRAKIKIPEVDSSIEVKIQNFLKELRIEFFTHQYIKIEHGYQCDILIPSMNLVIECDGDYWHKYPIGLDRDHIRTKELIEKGFKVLRLWEYEIRPMNINQFQNKINEVSNGLQ